MLDRRVEKLGRQYTGAGEQHEPPPDRLRSQDPHRRNHDEENAALDFDAALSTQGVPEPRQSEAQADEK